MPGSSESESDGLSHGVAPKRVTFIALAAVPDNLKSAPAEPLGIRACGPAVPVSLQFGALALQL